MILLRRYSLYALLVVLLLPRTAHLTGSPVTWVSLERHPLHLPQVRPGSPCPTSRPTQVDIPALGLAAHDWPWGLGSGPVYPETPGNTAVMTFYSPSPKSSGFYGSLWSGQKVP